MKVKIAREEIKKIAERVDGKFAVVNLGYEDFTLEGEIVSEMKCCGKCVPRETARKPECVYPDCPDCHQSSGELKPTAEMLEAIKRYEQAKADGTLDYKFPVFGRSPTPKLPELEPLEGLNPHMSEVTLLDLQLAVRAIIRRVNDLAKREQNSA